VTQYFISLAQQAPSGSSSPGGALGGMLIPMILIFGVMYLLVIRPQSKKAKEHQKMLSELGKGEDIVISGGIIGRITGIKGDEIILQVQEGVRFRVLRSAITGRYKASDAPKSDDKAS
jgi:preprotein translocase subunit YajC